MRDVRGQVMANVRAGNVVRLRQRQLLHNKRPA